MDGTNNECGDMCCVLMGDTVHWIEKRSRRYPKAVSESKRYQSATQGAIIERGLLNQGLNRPGDRFAALAQVFCDSPVELETVIQQVSWYKSDSNATTYTSHRQPPYTVGSLGDGGQLFGQTWWKLQWMIKGNITIIILVMFVKKKC